MLVRDQAGMYVNYTKYSLIEQDCWDLVNNGMRIRFNIKDEKG
jgi:hypothetical protein